MNSPHVKPFTGVPALKPAAVPSRRLAVVVNGKLRRPMNGVDMLLFGVMPEARPVQPRAIRSPE